MSSNLWICINAHTKVLLSFHISQALPHPTELSHSLCLFTLPHYAYYLILHFIELLMQTCVQFTRTTSPYNVNISSSVTTIFVWSSSFITVKSKILIYIKPRLCGSIKQMASHSNRKNSSINYYLCTLLLSWIQLITQSSIQWRLTFFFLNVIYWNIYWSLCSCTKFIVLIRLLVTSSNRPI